MQKQNCLKLRVVGTNNQVGVDTEVRLTDSKIGGIGYIPKDGEFPTTEDGKQYKFLMQLNLTEVSKDSEKTSILEELGLPTTGLLQFWALNNEYIGADLDKVGDNTGYKIVYLEEFDTQVTEDDIRHKLNTYFDSDTGFDYFPVHNEYALEIEVAESINLDEIDDTGLYFDSIDAESGHKIGGYPLIYQEDIFSKEELEEYDTLLLQLDTEVRGSVSILFGGYSHMGTAWFMGKKSDFENKNFDNVIYRWDTSRN